MGQNVWDKRIGKLFITTLNVIYKNAIRSLYQVVNPQHKLE